MEALNELLSAYGLLLVFVIALTNQGGIPVPAWPPLVVASAQAVERVEPVWPILVVATVAALIADILWYHAGRRYGTLMLCLICRVSLSPDSCVSSTRALYSKWGPPSLMVAKFIPGFAAVGTTLAGHLRTPLLRFAFFDGIGAMLWAGVPIWLGVAFHDAINEALVTLESLGRAGIALVLAALLAFVGHKAWKRRVSLRELRMDRISAPELHALMEQADKPLVVDVRTDEERADTGWIPGAIHATQVAALASTSGGEVVVYCDCPNEASAARIASQLKQLGFGRVRPLGGGFQAWRSHGLPIETSQRATASVETTCTAANARPILPRSTLRRRYP